MLNSTKALPLNEVSSHPIFSNLNRKDKANAIHRLLLDSAKDESEKELKTVLRATADFFREKFYGFTPAKIRAKIVECFKEYYDGDDYTPLEIENISEITGVDEDALAPVIAKMVRKGELIEGRRRRIHEPGKHFNPLYRLNKGAF